MGTNASVPVRDQYPDEIWPVIDKELLNMLDMLFADKCPDLDDEDRTIWFQAGCAHVVKVLTSVYREQQDNLEA